jgi:uncharacterized protein (TIGR00251 family)
MLSPLKASDGGVILQVKATPRAGRNEITGVRSGRLLVKVTAPPEDGKANAAIIKLLSKQWKLRASDFNVVAGAGSREKVLFIRGATLDDIPLAFNG